MALPGPIDLQLPAPRNELVGVLECPVEAVQKPGQELKGSDSYRLRLWLREQNAPPQLRKTWPAWDSMI